LRSRWEEAILKVLAGEKWCCETTLDVLRVDADSKNESGQNLIEYALAVALIV